MESIEQTGRTVEEAVEAALARLGLTRDEVDVEVLAEESRGLLGILGYSAARVKVTVRSQQGGFEPSVAEAEEQPDADEDFEAEQEPEYEPYEPPEREPEPAEFEGEPSELAIKAVEILSQILSLMGMDATPKLVGDDEESVSIDIRSDTDLGLLIGKRGQTLAALQLIVAMMANRDQAPEDRRRVILDAEGYRSRRERTLESMARNAAHRAKRTGRPVTLAALNPRERRIIHITLADDPSVTTRSEGEDPDRNVIVAARRTTR